MSYGFGQLNNYAHSAHMNAVDKGFWEDVELTDVRHLLSLLMLVNTEVSEAAEAVRKGDHLNLQEELADICIRVFDFAEGLGFNLEQAIVNKMQSNESRPRKHGKLA